MTDNDEPFLKRWSRKKRLEPQTQGATEGAPAEHGAAGLAAPAPAGAQDEVAADTGTTSAPLDLDALPKPDDLTPTSDIKDFLDPRVPASLRDAALKRMWTLDPAIRDFIEVAENQWDWNTPGGAPGYEPLEDAKLVARLLDHAVGSIMGPREDHPHILSSHVPTRTPPQALDAAAHKTPSAAYESVQAPDCVGMGVSEPVAPPDAVPHSAALANPPSGSARRRHGGALPS